ncbi:MAG: RNA-directed DNA polymerase [Paraclostridium sp.]
MKRQGFIYEKIISEENIRNAILRASKGKRQRSDVKRILGNMDKYILKIQDLLENEKYIPSDYKIGIIKEGIAKKERIIYKPNFYPDQIIHWALILQINTILKKGMHEFTCGSVPGRGIHYGKKYVRKWIDSDRKNTKYCLKMDITKFYPSIDNNILKGMIRSKIKDSKVINLIDSILDKEKGLPIGILISQWFANFYLQELDHFIKEKLKAKYYIRYMDDMVVFGRNKKELHKIRKEIEKYLQLINLKLKGNWQVFKLDCRALDFMGFRFFRRKTILRKSIMLRITRKAKRIFRKPNTSVKNAQSMLSYLGWIKHSNSRNLYLKWIKPYIDIEQLKNIVRKHSKVGAKRCKNLKMLKAHRLDTQRKLIQNQVQLQFTLETI